MQKNVPSMFILALFLVTCITACGGTTTATPVYKLPTPIASLPASKPYLMGGAMQGTPLVLSGTVSTLAGTAGLNGIGFSNFTGNSSVTAKFDQPNDVTTDGTDFYVADYFFSLIRKIYTDPVSGEVRTSTLQCIDSVTGVAISFFLPTGITTDGTHLYVVDRGYNCIRVITIADDGTGKHKVVTIGSPSGVGGYADSTEKIAVLFNQPTGITTDGVNVYVTDYGNATVRWIDTSNSSTDSYAVYTLAGIPGVVGVADSSIPSAASFNLPTRITTDGINLFVTDVFSRTIRRIAIATGAVTTLAGNPGQLGLDGGTLDGVGAAASFRQPSGITSDGTNLYVTDSYLNIIRKIVISSGAVSTLPIPSGSLHTSLGLTTDGVSLFVADTYTVFRDIR